MQLCCKFPGMHPCVGVVSIKLQSRFVEMALLHGCFGVGLFHVCKKSISENTSRGLLLNTGNIMYVF